MCVCARCSSRVPQTTSCTHTHARPSLSLLSGSAVRGCCERRPTGTREPLPRPPLHTHTHTYILLSSQSNCVVCAQAHASPLCSNKHIHFNIVLSHCNHGVLVSVRQHACQHRHPLPPRSLPPFKRGVVMAWCGISPNHHRGDHHSLHPGCVVCLQAPAWPSLLDKDHHHHCTIHSPIPSLVAMNVDCVLLECVCIDRNDTQKHSHTHPSLSWHGRLCCVTPSPST